MRLSRSVFARALLAIVPGLALGCEPSSSSERPGDEFLKSLPSEVARLLPADVVLCHHESRDEPANYELWIIRSPGKRRVEFPKKLKGLERHELPASILVRMLSAKAPRLEPRAAERDSCRYTHWTVDDSEFQIREIVTDSGWFASLERMPLR